MAGTFPNLRVTCGSGFTLNALHVVYDRYSLDLTTPKVQPFVLVPP